MHRCTPTQSSQIWRLTHFFFFIPKEKSVSYPCPHSWLFKQSFPPAKRMRCSDAHKSCRLWALRMNHLVSVYMQDSWGSLFSLLCKSTMTSRLLNYLPVLMVIAHSGALSHSTKWSLCVCTLILVGVHVHKERSCIIVRQMLAMRFYAPRDDRAGFNVHHGQYFYLFGAIPILTQKTIR